MAKAWRRPESSYVKELMQERLMLWRRQEAILRLDKPTRLDRARRLGYKGKPGYIVVRVRVRRGGLRKTRPKMGRSQKRMGVTKYKPAKSVRLIAEERAGKRFPNLEVLNSYWVGEDGRSQWFEVMLVDKTLLPEIELGKGRGRAHRGLTSAGRKVRGLRS